MAHQFAACTGRGSRTHLETQLFMTSHSVHCLAFFCESLQHISHTTRITCTVASSVTVKQLDTLLTEHSVTSSAGCVSVGKRLLLPVVILRVRCSHVWGALASGHVSFGPLCAALEFWHLPQYQRDLRLVQIILVELGSRELISDLTTTCWSLSCRPCNLFRNPARHVFRRVSHN